VAEVLYGHGREVRDFLVATVGRGIGLGIVANGTVYRGGRGGAGEFGHVPVLADGPVCACGRRGCLEAVVGEQALTRAGRVAGVLGPRQGLGALARAAERSRPNARAVFAEAGQVLGRALAGIANVLDPDRILLLGEGTEHWAFWDDAFRTEFARHHVGRDEVDIVVDAWDDSAWAQGAAALVLAAPFDLDGFGGEQADQVVARLHSVADGLAG
jgi:predicted NBD/HSP70 family sugar kinase